jgi:hypothetical protein
MNESRIVCCEEVGAADNGSDGSVAEDVGTTADVPDIEGDNADVNDASGEVDDEAKANNGDENIDKDGSGT